MFTAGQFVKQHHNKEYEYLYFLPTPINSVFHWQDTRIDVLLEQANHFIGQLDAYSLLMPDVIDYFISMHVVKEATSSSKIEGTKTGVDEAVLPEEEIDPERRDDWHEVQNYIQAMHYSIQKLDELPLSMRLLNNTHKVLMQGVRGEGKTPGKIRHSQNWIGGTSLKDAFFIPPHNSELAALLADMEHYWHNGDLNIPHLVKIAIAHYQFETIHPYQDGNGRIGRLLITLYLMDKQLLRKPTLYLSDFFERNRGAYYDALTVVRMSNNIEQWIRFFLTGVIDVAQKSRDVFQKIIALDKKYSQSILQLRSRAADGNALLKYLYTNPKITIQQLTEAVGISFPTASNLVDDFVRMGILVETTGMQRGRMFEYREYLELFR